MDTKLEDRDEELEEKLSAFPYVNGGLFTEEDTSIPQFSEELRGLLLGKASEDFDWRRISPTIFGAVFESTLNPETRRSGGMHYTSIENIHKVIDPLFMDELTSEFNEIKASKSAKTRNEKLLAFQKKLGSLTFLDPACGSGNFLTETYLSLRRLENECIKLRLGGQQNALDVFGDEFAIQVSIHQFYGIEINDFAAVVAKTALWIAESQMMNETAMILSRNLDFLPLKDYSNIVEGNALRMDWGTLGKLPEFNAIYAEKLNVNKIDENFGNIAVKSPEAATGGFRPLTNGVYKELNVVTKEVEEKELPKEAKIQSVEYDFIMGNPPFVGKSYQTERQKDDMKIIFDGIKNYGNLDYVASWYKKAFDFVQNGKTHCTFVSTNSVCQGIAVPPLWEYAREKNISINFAYQTFKWHNETADKSHMAAVHCVIIGFSLANKESKDKFIFDSGGIKHTVENINAYLLDAPNIIVKDRPIPLADVPPMIVGSCPTDGGNLILQEDEKSDLLARNPAAQKYIKKYVGSDEFINGGTRYCLWLKDCPPDELSKMPSVLARVKRVKEFRTASKKEQTRKRAETPTLFAEDRYVAATSIIIPMLSSENRKYVPIGFIDKETVASNLASVIPNGDLLIFGIITSNVCMAWMRTVGSRMKSDYRFSASLVYNTFPWPKLNDKQKAKIEETAKGILDARKKFPNATMAQLYNGLTMPPELRKAHQENDKAVMKAYGFPFSMTASECVAELFKLYEKLANGEK